VRMRPYQSRQVEAVIDRFGKGDSSLILQSATGSGKTTMATELATRWSRRGWVLYVVPRVEIFGQTLAALRGARLQVTELAAGDKTVWPRSGVLLAMGATLQRRLERGIPPPAGILVDEAHYAPAVAEAIRRCWPRVPMAGLTATPCRLQDAKLASMYQRILPGPQVSDLIAQGYLVPCRTLTAKAPDLRGVRVVAGEYDAAGLGAAFSALVGDVAGTWVKEARGRRTICFAATKDHGRSLVAAYKAKGVKAAFVHAETPADVRESLLSDLRKHRIDVLVNVGLFVEGLDLPEVDCVQLATATRSLARYLQMVGRGMRTAPGKRDLLLLDHGANVELHGLPDDDRVWSLDEDVAVKGGDVPLRACRLCGGLYRVVCHRCHPARRSVPVQVAGSLREVATTRRPAVYVMPSPPRPCPPHLMAWRAVWDRLEQERFARGGATREVDDLIRASVGVR
jgi:DNA repair protein RadD